MPYMLVVFDASADTAYWMYVQAYFERHPEFTLAGAGATVTVHIPLSNVLDEDTIRRFARFRDAVLGQVREVVHYDD